MHFDPPRAGRGSGAEGPFAQGPSGGEKKTSRRDRENDDDLEEEEEDTTAQRLDTLTCPAIDTSNCRKDPVSVNA